jgi:hypothetical protein
LVFEVLFPCALSSLGLASGSFAPDPSGRPLPLSLAGSIVEFRVPPGSDPGAAKPAATSSVPPELAAIKLSAGFGLPDPCVVFDNVTQRLPVEGMDSGDLSMTVGIGGHRVLLATWTGLFFIASRDQPPQRLTGVSTTTPHSGAWLAPSGELWLAGPGSAGHGPPEGPFTSIAARTGTIGAVRIVGPTTSTVPFELFADDTFTLEHYTPANGWKVLDRRHTYLTGAQDPASMVWVGPNEFWVTGFHDLVSVQHYKDEIATNTFLPEGDSPRTLGLTPIGLLVKSGIGDEIYRWTGERWAPLHASVSLDRVTSILPFRTGFVLGGDYGAVVQYVPDGNGFFCPNQAFFSHGVKSLIRTDQGVVAIEQEVASAAFLTPNINGPVATCSP